MTDVAEGATAEFAEAPAGRVPLSASIEADADHDGYGDETQDKCPASAKLQVECPKIGLELFAVAGKGAITVLVVTDHEAPVTVSATTKAGKRHALKGTAVTLKGVTRRVAPGKLAKFKLKYTGRLRSALASLAPGKSLALHVKATAKSLLGHVSRRTSTLRLKG
jgi:hypothetical protein